MQLCVLPRNRRCSFSPAALLSRRRLAKNSLGWLPERTETRYWRQRFIRAASMRWLWLVEDKHARGSLISNPRSCRRNTVYIMILPVRDNGAFAYGTVFPAYVWNSSSEWEGSLKFTFRGQRRCFRSAFCRNFSEISANIHTQACILRFSHFKSFTRMHSQIRKRFLHYSRLHCALRKLLNVTPLFLSGIIGAHYFIINGKYAWHWWSIVHLDAYITQCKHADIYTCRLKNFPNDSDLWLDSAPHWYPIAARAQIIGEKRIQRMCV